MLGSPLGNDRVLLEPAHTGNIDLLVHWTLDPVAQGPYKRVPSLSADELHHLFLHSPDRWYYLIRTTSDQKPLGRFYYRAWRFPVSSEKVDWELNLFIADPTERGKGYGTAAQSLALEFLLDRPETHSVFAYTWTTNQAEQRALRKAGFDEVDRLPSPYYQVPLPPEDCLLFVRRRRPV